LLLFILPTDRGQVFPVWRETEPTHIKAVSQHRLPVELVLPDFRDIPPPDCFIQAARRKYPSVAGEGDAQGGIIMASERHGQALVLHVPEHEISNASTGDQ